MQPPMTTAPRVWLLPLVLAAGLDALALAALVVSRGAAWSCFAAAALHLLAFGAAGVPSRASRTERTLMAALTLTLPVLGAPVAMVVLATRRRGEVGRVPAREAPEPRALTVADVRRLTDELSASESLMSGSPDERSATVGMLTRHPDAASIALLRRAVAAGDADVAVEAALALEDLGAQLDARAAAAHEELDGNPGFERALTDADMLAAAVHSGLPDASLMASLVADARRGYERAAALCPQRLPEMAGRWFRLEMDALCPDGGLAVLDRAAAVSAGHGER
jgi:hypothetical protein